jgi:hypothetical protein
MQGAAEVSGIVWVCGPEKHPEEVPRVRLTLDLNKPSCKPSPGVDPTTPNIGQHPILRTFPESRWQPNRKMEIHSKLMAVHNSSNQTPSHFPHRIGRTYFDLNSYSEHPPAANPHLHSLIPYVIVDRTVEQLKRGKVYKALRCKFKFHFKL